MSELQKATLQTVDSNGKLGEPIPVQFNPSSLKLQISNRTAGGVTLGEPNVQYLGSSSTTLTLELIFDTADEGTTSQPVSVREKTSQVEQFVYPRVEGTAKQAPPRLRFAWGDLVLVGVVDSISIDLEHFAPNGMPLRARVGLSFKEQDRKFELLSAGPGANRGGGAPRPGQASLGAVGSFGVGFSAQGSIGLGASVGFGASAGFGGQVGLAISGESAAEFAARVGVDPAAWRGLSFEGGAGGSLSLEGGMEVGFSAGLNASAGMGVFTGASAGASVSLEASFGLKAEAGVTALAGVGAGARLQQGLSLASAGGIGAAIESVKIAKSQAAVSATRQAFAVAAPASDSVRRQAGGASAPGPSSAATRPSLPEQKRTPARLDGLPSPAAQQAAEAAPKPPVADPRSASFGFGVPLRQTFGRAALERAGSLQGRVLLAARTGKGDVPVTSDPTTAPWQALPAADRLRKAADAAMKHGRCKAPCDCAGPAALRGK